MAVIHKRASGCEQPPVLFITDTPLTAHLIHNPVEAPADDKYRPVESW